jgi:hypothetical protein
VSSRVSVTKSGPFDPEPILAVLERHGVEYVVVGGFAARMHGATRPSRDVDVTPATTRQNLDRLAAALRELHARIRTEGAPDGLPFSTSAEALAGQRILNLQTTYGELDLTIRPAAFEGGYDELATRALRRSVGNVQVRVAALADVIRYKEAAGRRKDQEALPELYQLAGAPANHRRTPGHRRLPPAASPPRPTPSSASPPPGSAPPGATVTVPLPGGSPVRPAAPGGNLPATGGLAAPGEPVRRHTALHGNDFPARQGYAWTSSRRCRPDRRPVPGSGGAIAVRTAG